MVCIIAVQVLNAADWSVILPITSDISDFLGLGGGAYGGWLVAALYLPFPLSLVVFRTIQSYKWGYLFWASSSVVGNLLYVLFLIGRPGGVSGWLIVSRIIQGMAQCVTFQNKQILAYTTSWDVRNVYQASWASGNIFGNALGVMLCATYDKFVGESYEFANDTPAYLVLGSVSMIVLSFLGGAVMVIFHPHGPSSSQSVTPSLHSADSLASFS